VQSHLHGQYEVGELENKVGFKGSLLDFVDNQNGVVRKRHECQCGLIFTSSEIFKEHSKKHEKNGQLPQLETTNVPSTKKVEVLKL